MTATVGDGKTVPAAGSIILTPAAGPEQLIFTLIGAFLGQGGNPLALLQQFAPLLPTLLPLL